MSNNQEALLNELVSFYEILGVDEEASVEEIQKAYRQKVRENPPEERPEEFKKVREAYDILRDPKKRMEYAQNKKHGEKVHELLQESVKAMNGQEFKKALQLINEAQDLDPSSVVLYQHGVIVGKVLGNDEIIEEQIEKMERNFSKEAQFSDYIAKAEFYSTIEREEETIEALTKAEELATEKDRQVINSVYADLYYHQRDNRRMVDFIEDKMLPSMEEQTIDDLPTIIQWINGLIDLGHWSEKPKMKKRIKTLLKSIEDEEDKEYALFALKKELKEFMQVSRFQAALFYLDLILLEEKSPLYRQQKKEITTLVKLEKEHNRIFEDPKIFPLVVIQAHELYAEDFLPHERLEEIRENFLEFEQEYQHRNEEFAAGILRLKKRYPNLYKYYKEEWDDLFKEKTRDLNREARRRLR